MLRMEENKTSDSISSFNQIYGQVEYDFKGDKVKEEEVRGREIIIHDFVILHGQYGEFAVVDAELTEEIEIEISEGEFKKTKRVQFAEGSDVIRNQLIKAREEGHLPLKATIIERSSDTSKMTYRTLS